MRWPTIKKKIEQMYRLAKGEQFMHENVLKFIVNDVVHKTVENQAT